jgi:hypothetical protein
MVLHLATDLDGVMTGQVMDVGLGLAAGRTA